MCYIPRCAGGYTNHTNTTDYAIASTPAAGLVGLAQAICSINPSPPRSPGLTPQNVPIFRFDDAHHEHDMFDAPEECPSFIHVIIKRS